MCALEKWWSRKAVKGMQAEAALEANRRMERYTRENFEFTAEEEGELKEIFSLVELERLEGLLRSCGPKNLKQKEEKNAEAETGGKKEKKGHKQSRGGRRPGPRKR